MKSTNSIQPLEAEEFFLWDQERLLIDVRPGKEFKKGSLPGAISMPCEKEGDMVEIIQKFKKLIGKKELHIIDEDAELGALLSSQIPLRYLEGGYKGLKKWQETLFSKGKFLVVLGGYTGSGKSLLLSHLGTQGFQVINLEILARNKGSAFGYLPGVVQPKHEQFQHELVSMWLAFDMNDPIFIEEKGPFLGKVGLPKALYSSMSRAPMIELEVPFQQRLNYLLQTYKYLEKDFFRNAIRSIENRMGMSQNHRALHYYDSGKKEECFELLLLYYDKAYEKRRKQGWYGEKFIVKHQPDSLEKTTNQIRSWVDALKK